MILGIMIGVLCGGVGGVLGALIVRYYKPLLPPPQPPSRGRMIYDRDRVEPAEPEEGQEPTPLQRAIAAYRELRGF